LARATGQKTTVKTPDAVIVDEQPELRIISDALWTRVQKRLKSRSNLGVHEYLGKVSAFTSLVKCEACGSPVFTRSISRKQGATRYLACGNRLGHGKLACTNSHYVREESLLARIQATFRGMFEHVEDLIAPIMAETRKLVNTNESTLKTAKAQATKLEDEIERLSAVVADKETPALAKRALEEQIAKRFSTLEQTREQVAAVAESSTISAAALEKAVRQAFTEAREDLRTCNTVPQLREFISRHVGPMLLTAEGTVVQGTQTHVDGVAHAPPETRVNPARPSSSPKRSACSRP
jgi:hypothetical protein